MTQEPTPDERRSMAESAAGWFLYREAGALARAGRYRNAQMLLDQLHTVGANADGYCLLGRIKAQQGDLEGARVDFTRALALDPGHVAAAAALARVATLAAPVPAWTLRRWQLGAGALAVLLSWSLLGGDGAPGPAGSPDVAPGLPIGLRGEAPDGRRGAPAGEHVDPEEGAGEIPDAVFSTYRDALAALQSVEGAREVRLVAVYRSGLLMLEAMGPVSTGHVRESISFALGNHTGIALDTGGVRVTNTYTVRVGDSLESIGVMLYGSPIAWLDLWRHNARHLPDPNKIEVGLVLATPDFNG